MVHSVLLYLAAISVICGNIWMLFYSKIFAPSQIAVWLVLLIFISSVGAATMLNVVVVHSLK